MSYYFLGVPRGSDLHVLSAHVLYLFTTKVHAVPVSPVWCDTVTCHDIAHSHLSPTPGCPRHLQSTPAINTCISKENPRRKGRWLSALIGTYATRLNWSLLRYHFCGTKPVTAPAFGTEPVTALNLMSYQCANHEEDFFKFCVLLRKSKCYPSSNTVFLQYFYEEGYVKGWLYQAMCK